MVRADADTRAGSGHFIRSLALAMAWKDRGGAATFLSRLSSASLKKRASSAGVPVLPLDHPHPDPEDLTSTLQILDGMRREGSRPWLVTDGYFFTPGYHRSVREAGHPLLVVDDTAHLPRYHASVVLNQNLGAESLEYEGDPDTAFLLGPRFALLRPEFRSATNSHFSADDRACRLVITMGGGDPHNVTRDAVRAVRRLEIANLECVVVLGPDNPHRGSIEEEVTSAEGQGRIRVAVDVENMAELFRWATVAVSAAGSTCWELACTGVAGVLIVTADNQLKIASELDARGAAVNLGWHEEVDVVAITGALEGLLTDGRRRREMAAAGQELVDGLGARRVAEVLLNGPASGHAVAAPGE